MSPTKPALPIARYIAAADGRTIVTGRLFGHFPGSPIELRFAFALNGEKITRLEIY